ncbi:VWA domain-containing protein [Flavobacteriaceae bacterium Ap0902]|nr:VWA domain-containing protein [Flavobacteriaceae bacterium Ap0902]
MSNFEFENPWFLLLLFLIPVILFWRLAFKNQTINPMKSPSIKAFGEEEGFYKWIKPLLNFLNILVLSLLIIAMARPRKVNVSTAVKSDEGVDIMMVVDVSLSMLARDLKPDRLAALQKVAENFVINRKSDRIGLVVYSGEAVTSVPLTTDRGVMVNSIRNLKTDQLEPGTAIGIGLATAINHLEHSKAKSKVVILITDGGESPVDYGKNMVYISPEDAAQIAADKDIKVYTIGIGTTGFIPLPRGYEHYPQRLFQLDENMLEYIAGKANGLYFRATDNDKLQEIYNEINQLEKSEINEIKYYTYDEYFRSILLYALFFLTLNVVLRTLIFKQLT